MVGLDFHRKLSKMSNPSLNRPINPGRQVNLGLFFHLSTTHVPAETYIYDSDAKAETKSLFGLKFANEIFQFIEENIKIDFEHGDC